MCELGVRKTCLQRVTDVARTSVYKHGLGFRYIWQIQQGRTYGELNGTSRQVMECYVQAQDARSWSLRVRWGRLGMGSSRMRQKRFQAAWHEPELFGTSSGYYEACMRCSVGCLMCWGCWAVAVWCILEGLAAKVRFVSWRADMARGKLFLSGNRLLKHDTQLGIILCQDYLVGAMLWGGPRMC